MTPLLAVLVGLASSPTLECYRDGQSAFRDGRLADAARLYLESAARPACASEAPMLRLNSALTRARMVGAEPSRGHCPLVKGFEDALDSGLSGDLRVEADAARTRHQRACDLAEVMYSGVATRPSAPPEQAPAVASLMPPLDGVEPAPYALIEDTVHEPYMWSAAVLGGLSAAGSGAMLALALDARRRRDDASAHIRQTTLLTVDESRARARYASADEDVVLYGAWFYGLAGLACAAATTGLTLWLLEDEPAPVALAVDERGSW